MRVITHDWFGISRSDTFKIIPLGDIHLGAKACDEEKFRRVVQEIKEADENTYWVGLGDYCLPLDAEILTQDGFKQHNEVSTGDMVLAFDGKNTTWTELRGKYITPFVPFTRLHSKSFDITCTPNHRWWVKNNHKDRWTGTRVRRAEPWPRKAPTTKLSSSTSIITAAICKEDGPLDITPEEAALIGWLVTDGFITIRSPNSFIAGIQQGKEPYRTQIRHQLASWFTKEYGPGDEISTFNLKVARLRDLFDKLGVEPHNLKDNLPSIVTRLSRSSRQAMMKAMLKAEGWKEGDHWRFSQQPGSVYDAFVILATLEGERLGLGGTNKAGVRQVPLMGYRPYANVANLKTEDVGTGPAWCPQTDHGSWITRLGNQVTITGNCDFITVKDPRFNAGGLAEWIYNPKALSDIARTQKDRFLDEIAPIADRCLGLIAGNHETAIHRHYERDIYSDIVNGIKDIAGWDAERKLSFGYAGWLYLRFYRHDNKRRQGHYITISLHHGFVGGRLKGAKALNMQRWLWSHNCDLAIFGHSHNTDIQTESVRAIDRNANLTNRVKLGCYAGTFLKGAIEESSTYSEIKGYFPQPTGGVIITLQPGATKHEDRIAISTRGLS